LSPANIRGVARKAKPVGQGLEDLYAEPLADFTNRRNALAKELRDAGDREAADDVKALRKPSLPAWAINQGVRADHKAAAKLLDAGDALRGAHEQALGGDADDLRVAMAKEADAVEAMTMAAVRAGEPEKLAGGMLDRVRDTLRAVAGDEELRSEFEAGCVTRDRKPGGMALGATPRGSSSKRKRKRPSGPTAAQRRKADAKVTKARKALDARRRDVAAATEKSERSRRAAKEAEARVADAEEAERLAGEDLGAAQEARAEL
jgi:hypothetical protein